MKETDLMIGDWVCLVDPDTKKRMNTKVRGIDLCGGGTIVLQWFEPIPLTPEILEKNGCTRYGKVYANLQQWVLKDGEKRKSFVQDVRTGEWNITDCWINYVHEFQHALKLCKIEKEIEL